MVVLEEGALELGIKEMLSVEPPGVDLVEESVVANMLAVVLLLEEGVILEEALDVELLDEEE